MPPLQQAVLNARHCRSLLACEGWQWFQSTLQTRMDRLAREVMESSLTDPERDRHIQEWRLLKELHHHPATQLQASLSVLEGAGGREEE